MIKSIRFKFGPTPNDAPIQITPGPMTVIVGPNNSGKSLTLQELHRSLHKAKNNWHKSRWKIVADIEPGLPPPGELRDHILGAINTDLRPLRSAQTTNSELTELLAGLFGKPDLADTDHASVAYWTGLLDKKELAQKLVEKGKLRLRALEQTDPSEVPLAAPRFTFGTKIADLFEWFKSEGRSTLELIQAVAARSDEGLLGEGFIDLRGYFDLFRRHCMLLDGHTRLALTQDEPSESLHELPGGTVMRLWHARQGLEQLRKLVLDAFDKHLCVDLLDLGKARLVLSEHPPLPNLEDRLDAEARAFFAAARPLEDFSDGVRTYIGLHAELIAQDRRFVMLDEPEAFLHPPLARRLGSNLSKLAAERGSCVFAATHSPDFLMGCIESGVGVNIVRLGYRNGVASAHLLPRDELETMMVDPLLRSTGILGALFHQAAVVVEGDSDRTFYTEVTERLRIHEAKTHPAALRDCVFLNAHSNGNVPRILAALRRLGVTSCGIVDLDLLKNNGLCTRLLHATGAPDSICNSIGYTRSQIVNSIEKLVELCNPNGLDNATPAERQGVEHFIDEMQRHGIFLPEVGPVEGWLKQLGVSRTDKKAWIPAIFHAMGHVHTGLKPGPGDVWEFVRRIGRYLEAQGAPTAPTPI